MEEKELQQSAPQHKPTINRALIVSVSALFLCFLSIVFLEVSMNLGYASINIMSDAPPRADSPWFIVANAMLGLWILLVLVAIIAGHKAVRDSHKKTATHTWSKVTLVCAYLFILVGIGVTCSTISTGCSYIAC
jgi:succinate dehydrogenase hydrophobic anchor subunit